MPGLPILHCHQRDKRDTALFHAYFHMEGSVGKDLKKFFLKNNITTHLCRFSVQVQH